MDNILDKFGTTHPQAHNCYAFVKSVKFYTFRVVTGHWAETHIVPDVSTTFLFLKQWDSKVFCDTA